MYREILIDKRDVDYQRILWRKSPAEAITEFQLLTVTYGTASAPYLALRVIRQLAEDEGSNFSLGKEVLLNNFDVDDVLFGAITSAKEIRHQRIALLSRTKFTLRKWASNSAQLLADIDTRDHGIACSKRIQDDESLKILGVEVSHNEISIFTKRTVLSIIASLFDPLGWLSLVVITAKIIKQSLWAYTVDWDSPLPSNILASWYEFYDNLPVLANVSIPRWISTSSSTNGYELHGFWDASTKAYSAVTYIRVQNGSTITCHLLISKTRVAPLKQLTVPRLELCGAILLSRLLTKTASIPKFAYCKQIGWTDSTIVLDWLRGSPSQWKTFVANRVAEVQTLLPTTPW